MKSITNEFIDELNSIQSSNGFSTYEVYSYLFDIGCALISDAYDRGRKDAVRHGSWYPDGEGGLFCSVCLSQMPPEAEPDYCPHCGAKMDKED